MPIQHLLKQIETYTTNRENRDVRPEWLTQFIDDIAQLIDPISGVGRVGFDCQLTEDCWIVGIYLGSTEVVGGRFDGRTQFASFALDLRRLIGKFVQIREFWWNAMPAVEELTDDGLELRNSLGRSYVTISGFVAEEPIRLNIFSVPPDDAGPGLRQYPDGTCEIA